MATKKTLNRFAANKIIPALYEEEILTALSHYPELIATRIAFVPADKASVPYGTKPTFSSCFKPNGKRLYIITILERARYPESKALFRNLSFSMRVGVIAHELGHVKQYEQVGVFGLFKTFARFAMPKQKRLLERDADMAAIRHGMGRELLQHALYIRSIPGYVEQRPAINRDYLMPDEIEHLLHDPDIGKAA
jgi:hypothetical protein